MKWKRLLSLVASVGIVAAMQALPAPPANAYCTTGIGRWLYSDYTPIVRPSVPSTWNTAITSARAQWNGISGSTLHYYTPTFNSNIANPEFQLYLADFGYAGLPDVPGISLGADVAKHSTVSIALNSNFTWNTSGTMSQSGRKVDVWTIVVHEMGHASGLAHPYASVCGSGHPTTAEKASVMYVDWTKKRYPNADDKAGIASRY